MNDIPITQRELLEFLRLLPGLPDDRTHDILKGVRIRKVDTPTGDYLKQIPQFVRRGGRFAIVQDAHGEMVLTEQSPEKPETKRDKGKGSL